MIEQHDVPIGSLTTRDGAVLENVSQRVTIYGGPSARTVLVPHALTGSSNVRDWWGELVGPGKVFDPAGVRVIGINALGSCYGSTGPAGKPGFPHVCVEDIVAAQARALDVLGIENVDVVVGASLGGMQALQWALDFPERVRHAILVGSHDHQSAMGIALNALQREAIAIDPQRGIRLARKIAMLSYKSDALLRERHDRRADRKGRFRFDVEGYLEHQAEVFEARMDPYSYVALTHAMDSFDVRCHPDASGHPDVTGHPDASCHPELVEGRPSIVEASKPSLHFIGITSDWLFTPQDVRAAAQRFAAAGYDSRYDEIVSDHGHDAFLAEPQKLAALLASG